uniref:Uncharacterized protein n=1 Tax=Nelumbo nucifera TaxID=4432 RepID=A0A822XTC2_NELNU|nr:TPA_asm: hypothetical protein HUJ06_024426 [Nelumbo nucifera]
MEQTKEEKGSFKEDSQGGYQAVHLLGHANPSWVDVAPNWLVLELQKLVCLDLTLPFAFLFYFQVLIVHWCRVNTEMDAASGAAPPIGQQRVEESTSWPLNKLRVKTEDEVVEQLSGAAPLSQVGDHKLHEWRPRKHDHP